MMMVHKRAHVKHKGARLFESGERLREERERLGLSQTAFGELGGVSKRAQINYEQGARSPDAVYLNAIAAAGVDVLYIVTGKRQAPPPTHLPPDEQLLIESYRALDAAQRKRLLAGLLTGDPISGGGKKARGQGEPAPRNQTVSGVGHRVAGRDYNEKK